MKKILIVTYYWPPAGGPGVQRILKIVEHLPEQGWEPIVLTVENPSAPAIDESLLARIPENIKIYKTKTSEPFEAYKKLTGKKAGEALPKNISLSENISAKEKLSRWIRANLFIPDARKGWKRFLVREGMKIIENEKPDLIFSTSPPHSLQLGAMRLAKKSGLPWVADLRDPWSEAYWEADMPKSKRSEAKNRVFESKVLNTADHITTVGKGIAGLLQKKTTKPVSVIYNGYREVDNTKIDSEYFEILHLGNLSSIQSLNELLEAIKGIRPELRKKIKLRFIGSLAEEYRKNVDEMDYIEKEYLPFLPYEKMMKEAQSASMLYLPRLNSSYSKSLISAKIFDYLALSRPILAIADKDSDIAEILRDCGAGKSFESKDIPSIQYYIEQHLSGTLESLIDPKKLKTYSLESNISTLVEKLEELL
jgi:glycosyltransferase involved in cell wall biosynthesis